MKNILSVLASVAIATTLTSCSEDTYYINSEVLNKEVTFSTQGLISSTEDTFSSNGYQTLSTTADYLHLIPNEFKAYFVSKETRGQYVVGQVVAVEDVETGDNSIIIPELEYDIYVTNLIKSEEDVNNKWYTENNIIPHLPKASDELYLFGTTVIDYKAVDSAEVTLENYYSAVMISNNDFVTGYPKHNPSGEHYVDANTDWYLKYIRTNGNGNGNTTTNTKIPISIIGHNSTIYNLNRQIEANKIYKYTIDGNVQDNGDGGLTVIVEAFGEVEEETIEIL